MFRFLPLACLAAAFPAVLFAESGDSEMPEFRGRKVVVTATRSPQNIEDLAANVTVLGEEELRLSASQRLDGFLRQVPGFSLLRQSTSIVSAPAIQGVSLRGTGATAPGRTLVLLDGVPLNDPIRGHVVWSRIPIGSIERIEVVRGGGSGIWGSQAMGGVIQILTKHPEGRSLRFRGQGGSFGTGEVDVFASEGSGPFTFSVGGNRYETDGYHILREDQRGAIDRPSFVEHGTAYGRVDYRRSPRARLYLQGSYFELDQGTGTPLGYYGLITRTLGTGGTITTAGGNQWTTDLFSSFTSYNGYATSVSNDRSTERPTYNIFHSPTNTLGASLQWARKIGNAHHFSAGTDYQWNDCRSRREDGYSSAKGAFTEEEDIKGKQQLAGVFVQDVFRPSLHWQIVAGVRLDAIRSSDASVARSDLESGEITESIDYADEARVIVNPSLGVVRHVSNRISLRGSAYRAFRAPTIAELYQGFSGFGGVVNAGNPDLDPERMTGGETGVDLRLGGGFEARLTGFLNEVNNVITQRTIAWADEEEETVIGPCGTVPAGGVCRQTDNLGRVRSRGVELEAAFRPYRSWLLSGSYIYDDAVLLDPDDPSLEGNRVRQVPRHQFVLRTAFDMPSFFSGSLQGRYVGERFEDDQNSLRMDELFVVDLFLSRRILPWWEAFLAVENLFDTEFEVRRTTSGLAEIGAPRFVQGGIRLSL
ncbi:MAG: TonB-dependent receptor [Candidatus Eisenbacteria bacterium]